MGKFHESFALLKSAAISPDEDAKTEEDLKQELKEELGDVLSNLIILSQKYDLDLQDIMDAHVTKLSKRFETSK